MDTALPQKFPFILDRNLAKANCTENQVCTSCDTVVLVINISSYLGLFSFKLSFFLQGIDGAHFREVCTKYIYDKCPVVVGIGPIEQLFNYVTIRSNLYWLRV